MVALYFFINKLVEMVNTLVEECTADGTSAEVIHW